jgi:hypothetical protein
MPTASRPPRRTLEYASKADRDAALSTGMTDGMEASYQLLDRLLGEQ